MTVSAHVTLTVAYLPSYIQEVLDSNGNLEAIGLVISQVQLGKCTKTRYRLVIALGYAVQCMVKLTGLNAPENVCIL